MSYSRLFKFDAKTSLEARFRVLKGGDRWIRTTVGIHQQIYSLPHLAALVYPLIQLSVKRSTEIVRKSTSFFDSRKLLVENFLNNFYKKRIPKLNPLKAGAEFFSNKGTKS